jgi:thiosulfate/3-mercaptopyruvate sulfurtransferase
MPYSFSLPFNVFLQKHSSKQGSEYTTFLTPSEIQNVLEATVGSEEVKKILKGERPVITTCGSGMTAGVLWLGLELLGAPKIGLYDEVKLITLFRLLFSK